MPNYKPAVKTSEIPDGTGKICRVNDHEVAIFNVGGQFHCVTNVCPHRGGPLAEGELEGNVVTCPWHGWRFDVTTGASPVNPAATIEKYLVRIQEDEVQVDI